VGHPDQQHAPSGPVQLVDLVDLHAYVAPWRSAENFVPASVRMMTASPSIV
jgi:hypothetical protein